MEEKHTPGPWVADYDIYPIMVYSESQRRPTYDEIDNVYGEAMEFIANTGCNKANARLIAAAPELLEALQEIIASSDAGNASILDSLTCKARASISKATGAHQ